MFAHGFAITYGEIEPAPRSTSAWSRPKAPGHLVRRQYQEGHGVPGLMAVHQDATGTARDLVAGLRQGHRLHARPA